LTTSSEKNKSQKTKETYTFIKEIGSWAGVKTIEEEESDEEEEVPGETRLGVVSVHVLIQPVVHECHPRS
jgi:hypothetical protein